MDYQELREQVAAVPPSKARDYRELLSLSGVAGDVWPQLKGHLEVASTCDEFFERMYNDDACRFENVWALWARLNGKKWPDRFEAERVLRNLVLDNRGIFLTAAESELLIPLMGRGQSCDLYVFPENGFNEKAAEFYGSIDGKHTCCGLELDGAFDIFRARRTLIFERWDIDQLKRRANGKGQIRTGCDCAATW